MNVVLVGDSIRLGYQPVVVKHLAGMATVRATQENCGSTREILSNFDDWVTSFLGRSAVVHLNAGLHDLQRVDGAHGDPKVSIDEYRTNLGRILSRLADDERCPRVVLATSTPIDDARHDVRGEPNRFDRDVRDYNAALIEVAGRHGAAVHDLCAVISTDPSSYLDDDGVHLTQSGNTIAGQTVASAVLAEFAGGGASEPR